MVKVVCYLMSLEEIQYALKQERKLLQAEIIGSVWKKMKQKDMGLEPNKMNSWKKLIQHPELLAELCLGQCKSKACQAES